MGQDERGYGSNEGARWRREVVGLRKWDSGEAIGSGEVIEIKIVQQDSSQQRICNRFLVTGH